jgi:hypothetical protein
MIVLYLLFAVFVLLALTFISGLSLNQPKR